MTNDEHAERIQWQPSISETELWGADMTTRLAGALEQRAQDDAQRSGYLQQLREQAAKGQDQEAAGQLKKLITEAPGLDRPTLSSMPKVPLATVPIAKSCVWGFGPYNTWALTGDGSVRAATPDEAPSDSFPGHELDARLIAAEGGYSLTVGSGCWFQVSETGPHVLTAHFRHNSEVLVFGGFGYAFGSITFAGSVWGASEGRWVDRGGFGTLFDQEHYLSFFRPPTSETIASGVFDAVAGGAYYCAGRVVVEAGAWGFESVAHVEALSIMDYLQVCTQ